MNYTAFFSFHNRCMLSKRGFTLNYYFFGCKNKQTKTNLENYKFCEGVKNKLKKHSTRYIKLSISHTNIHFASILKIKLHTIR